jgi:hypothetical protein
VAYLWRLCGTMVFEPAWQLPFILGTRERAPDGDGERAHPTSTFCYVLEFHLSDSARRRPPAPEEPKVKPPLTDPFEPSPVVGSR